MELDELKMRVREKIVKYFPSAEIVKDTDELITFKSKKGHEAGVYYAKMMAELETAPPHAWDEIVDRRFRTMGMVENDDKIDNAGLKLTPRQYSKGVFKNMLDKFVVLKDLGDEAIVLCVENDAAYIGASRNELIRKFGFTEERIKDAVKKFERENMPSLFKNCI